MFVGEKIQIKLRDNSVVKGTFKGINIDGSLKLENDKHTSLLHSAGSSQSCGQDI